MKDKDIAGRRDEVRRILQEQNETVRVEKLKEVARRVGAGTEHPGIVIAAAATSGGIRTETRETRITEYELTSGINDALQTEAMINACAAASGNVRVAIVAVVVSLLTAMAACISAGGAWAAVRSMEKEGRYALSGDADGRAVWVLDTKTGELWKRRHDVVEYLGTREKPRWEVVEYPNMVEPIEREDLTGSAPTTRECAPSDMPKWQQAPIVEPAPTTREFDLSDLGGTLVIPEKETQSRGAGNAPSP